MLILALPAPHRETEAAPAVYAAVRPSGLLEASLMSDRTLTRHLRTMAGAAALVLAAAPARAEAGKQEQGAFVLLLAPLGLVAIASLQAAALLVFPRFSRRCAVAVRRYRRQTILAGFTSFLAVFLLCMAVGGVTKNKQLGGLPLLIGSFLAALGGTGVSLQVGKWGLARLGSAIPAHPVVEVLSGVCLVGWGLVVPVVGLVLGLGAACAALGAFVVTAIRGGNLDESLMADAMPPAVPPPPGPVPPLAHVPPPAAPGFDDPAF
jgi:hypothetical protein